MQNQQATFSSSVNARKSAVAATAGGLAPDGNNIHQNKAAEEDYRDILASNGGEASISSLNTFDQIFLAEDDENSLLDGATEESIKHEKELPLSYQMKRDEVTKRFFWPFHRMFDIHGRRKLDIHSKEPVVYNSTTAKEWDIPTFVNPLSERVDRGLNMDITDKTTTPFEYKIRGPQVIGKCEGKIYYMGIIDILQQFNLKKRVEARYRRLSGSGWQDASCVHPELYAERFLKFFDEYTSKHYDPLKKKEEEEEDSEDEENVEQVVFHEEGKEPEEGEGEGENRRPLFNDQ